MNHLLDRLDALYSAFSDVPKPTRIQACPCCLNEKEICTLLSKPLRELSEVELSSYSGSAFLTVGTQVDYLYFLSRIIEIACLHKGQCSPDFEITGRAVGETCPAEWPEHRKTALLDVLHATLQNAIDDENGDVIDQLICAMAKMGVNIAPFLLAVETSSSAVLAYYERNSRSLVKSKLGNSFWERALPGFNEVIKWFQSPKVVQIIFDGYGLAPPQ